MQLTPGLGVVCSVLIMLLVREPVRGSAEHGTELQSTSWAADLKYLVCQYVSILSCSSHDLRSW